jgi:hypothetical protein
MSYVKKSSVDPPCLCFQEIIDLTIISPATVKSTECQTEEPIDEENDNERKTSVSSVTCFHSKKF